MASSMRFARSRPDMTSLTNATTKRTPGAKMKNQITANIASIHVALKTAFPVEDLRKKRAKDRAARNDAAHCIEKQQKAERQPQRLPESLPPRRNRHATPRSALGTYAGRFARPPDTRLEIQPPGHAHIPRRFRPSPP